MDNLYFLVNKWLVITSSLIVIYYSFRALNQCSDTTNFLVRLPLTMFLPAAIGALIYAKSGAPIHWSYTLIIVGIAFHFLGNRRTKRYQICDSITN